MATNSATVSEGGNAAPVDASQPSRGAERGAVTMAELRRVQLANEGMRLLLSSEVKKAEELFKSSR